MIRVLLIPSSDYLGHPFPQRHNHLFEKLHDEKDFEVHIIRFNIFNRKRLRSKCIIHEINLEFKTYSTPMYYLANVASYTNEILKIIKNESIDVVIAGNLLPPLTYKLVEQLLEKNIPFIFDLQDYYPVSATGYIVKPESIVGTIAKGFFETITQYLILKADIVTVPGVALAIYAKSVGAKKIEIIPNGIAKHFLVQHDGKYIRKKLGFEDYDIVVGYIGSIEFWLEMESLIKAVAKAFSQGISIKLLLIGKHLQTGYSRKVENLIRRYSIGKITSWLDFIPYEKVPEYIAAMNIGTIPFNVNNLTAYYAAPNKLWEYLSQGIIVAATPIPEVLLYSKTINSIKVVKTHEEYFQLFSKVAKIFENPNKEYIFPSSKIKQFLLMRTWNNSVKKLRNIILKYYGEHR